MRRWLLKSWVKGCGLTVELPEILMSLSYVEVAGIGGVAVKCIDTTRNTDCEGRLLRVY